MLADLGFFLLYLCTILSAYSTVSSIFAGRMRHRRLFRSAFCPLFELITTAVREDIGEIAVDYREDLASLLGKPSKPEAGSTISA